MDEQNENPTSDSQARLHRVTHALIAASLLLGGLFTGVAHTRLNQVESAISTACAEWIADTGDASND